MASRLRLTIYASELLADLRAEGWRAADVLPESSGHVRHQWADICEPGNLQTVARALHLAWAEATALPGFLRSSTQEAAAARDDLLRLPDKFECSVERSESAAMLILLRLHDLLVNAALAAFAETLPGADSSLWRRRRKEALEALRATLISTETGDEVSLSCFAFRRTFPGI